MHLKRTTPEKKWCSGHRTETLHTVLFIPSSVKKQRPRKMNKDDCTSNKKHWGRSAPKETSVPEPWTYDLRLCFGLPRPYHFDYYCFKDRRKTLELTARQTNCTESKIYSSPGQDSPKSRVASVYLLISLLFYATSGPPQTQTETPKPTTKCLFYTVRQETRHFTHLTAQRIGLHPRPCQYCTQNAAKEFPALAWDSAWPRKFPSSSLRRTGSPESPFPLSCMAENHELYQILRYNSWIGFVC